MERKGLGEMSSDKRTPLAKAQEIAAEASVMFERLCSTLTIAGSIRRQKEDVGDIEIVVIPNNAGTLRARLDNLLTKNIITQALYRHVDGKGNESYVPRWGEKLRCFRFQGMTIELVIASPENYGYQLWLKTGPGDANQLVMNKLLEEQSSIRFNDGFGWYTEYKGSTPVYIDKLNIPDEDTLFKALRLPFIAPRWRTAQVYKAEWTGSASKFILMDLVIKEPKQGTLI
jgi:DNA polymerase/3'-5' exonuclease PolX